MEVRSAKTAARDALFTGGTIHSQWKVRPLVIPPVTGFPASYLSVRCAFHAADLHQIIKSGQTLTVEHVQYFVYQILRGPCLPFAVPVISRRFGNEFMLIGVF